jgi:hypothetical protein
LKLQFWLEHAAQFSSLILMPSHPLGTGVLLYTIKDTIKIISNATNIDIARIKATG